MEYEQQFAVRAKTQHNEKPVRAVACYKGIKNFFALPVITEIGDQKLVFIELYDVISRCLKAVDRNDSHWAGTRKFFDCLNTYRILVSTW